jgi:hypothetical protein
MRDLTTYCTLTSTTELLLITKEQVFVFLPPLEQAPDQIASRPSDTDSDNQPIQLVIPLHEALDLIQRGLMNLAMAAFTQTRRMRDGPRGRCLSRREESR